MKIIEYSRLCEAFYVDIEHGRLFWIKPPSNHPGLSGREAGGPQPGRGGKIYWVVRIDGVHHKRGRLIFLAANGRLPHPCVDHINGNSLDDQIENLREATVTQNAWNHKSRKRILDLPMGVRVVAGSGRYEARISFRGTQLHLGAYDTSTEAHLVYLDKRKELFGEFA